MATLLYYARNKHRGFDLTEAQVLKYAHKVDASYVAGHLKARTLDKSRLKPRAPVSRPDPKLPLAKEPGKRRHPKGFVGGEVSIDPIGPYKAVKAVGGAQVLFVFCAAGHRPPYMYCVEVPTRMSRSEARASYALKRWSAHAGQHGHYVADWDVGNYMRSDSAGEFLSENYEQVCQELRYRQLLSTPFDHGQNGAVENSIGYVGRSVISSFDSAPWAPRELFLKCWQHQAHLFNLRVGDDGEPAIEAFEGATYDFVKRPTLPWGQLVMVYVPPDVRSKMWKFTQKAVRGCYVGLPKGIKEGIAVYVFKTKKIRVVRSYVILNEVPQDLPIYTGAAYPSAGTEAEVLADIVDGSDRYFEEDFLSLLGVEEEPDLFGEQDIDGAAASVIQELEPVANDGDDPRLGESVLAQVPHGTESIVVAAQLPQTYLHDDVLQHGSGMSNTVPVHSAPPSANSDTSAVVLTDEGAGSKEVLQAAAPPSVVQSSAIVPSSEEVAASSKEVRPSTEEVTDRATVVLPASDKVIERSEELPSSGPARLDFNEVVVEPILPEVPVLYYSIRFTSARVVGGSRRKQISEYAHLRSEAALALRTRERQRQTTIFLQEQRKAKAKKRLGSRKNPDKPSLYAALKGPYRQKVRDAIEAELTQYIDTFGAIKLLKERLPPDKVKKAVTSHYEIELKRDPFTNELIRVKARLVIHGNQTHKYAYDEIVSPTARPAVVKMVIAMMAKRLPSGRCFSARAWDVVGAFLQNDIKKRTTAKQAKNPDYKPPEAILLRLPDGRYAELTAYCYGLKQASFEWYAVLHEVIVSAGFVQSSDPCVYHQWRGEDVMILTVHVDDILAVATDDSMLDELDAVLTREFESDKAKLKRTAGQQLSYLKMRIQIQPDGSVTLDQSVYIREKIVNEWGRAKSPNVDDSYRLISDEQEGEGILHPMQGSYAKKHNDDDAIDATWFRGIVGAINYAAVMTRPDLLFSMSMLASCSSAPTQLQFRILKRVMKYIVRTADLCLHFQRDDDIQLVGWADASYASREASRSQSGYCFALGSNNAMFHAKSQKQKVVTLSSTEAEYVALFHAATEAVFLRRILEELGFPQDPTCIYQDNTSTILWANNQSNHNRTKHIAIKYHYVRELIQECVIDVEYLATSEMIADVLTKPLIDKQYAELSRAMMGAHREFGINHLLIRGPMKKAEKR